MTMLRRRDLLIRSTIAAAGLGALGSFPSLLAGADGGEARPARRLRTAVCGTNSRGLALVGALTGCAEVEVATICDVDSRAIAKGIREAGKKQKETPRGERDFRRMLEDTSIDAVAIATPDHWHAPMALLALAAGKHVYVEKPLSQNPYEGELLVAAVKKHQRVLQMGAQRRSFPNMREAVRLIHEGAIGRTYFGRTWYANKRQPIGTGKPATVPDWLDYELWQGPAPRRPFRDNLLHYNWHWSWHYGTGEAHNNGTHEVDICRWALGLDLPLRTASNGGRYHFQGDDWETPDTQTIAWDFPGGKSMIWEGRSCNAMPTDGLQRGVMIYGTEGSALLDGNNGTFYDQGGKVTRAMKHQGVVDATNTVSSTGADLDLVHMQDFVDAIRTGRTPNCGVEDGHKSVLMLHLGNIAVRCGRSLTCDPANGHIQNDAEAMRLWKRDYEPGWEPQV